MSHGDETATRDLTCKQTLMTIIALCHIYWLSVGNEQLTNIRTSTAPTMWQVSTSKKHLSNTPVVGTKLYDHYQYYTKTTERSPTDG